MTSLRKRRTPIVLLIGLVTMAFVASACGGDDSSNNSNSSSTTGGGGSSNLSSLKATLQGSGSTFQANFNSAAIAGFQSVAPGVKITYGGGGSGKGKTDLANQVVDFAGTDSLIKPEDQAKYTKNGGVLYFPTVAAPITISYNLSGVDTLKLDAPTLAKIFQRDIKTWDDPAIKALNSGVNLPSTAI